MPRKSPRICSSPGCPALTPATYCEAHAKDTHREYKQTRTDVKEQRFYSSRDWIRIRNHKRTTHPLCEDCMDNGRLTPMDVADHIVELKDDWTLRLTLSNLRSLCHGCHNKKTAKVKKERKHNG